MTVVDASCKAKVLLMTAVCCCECDRLTGMESSALRWSTNEMDLRRFVELYGNSLPAILLTTDGYMVDETNDVSGDQVTYKVNYLTRCTANTVYRTKSPAVARIPDRPGCL